MQCRSFNRLQFKDIFNFELVLVEKIYLRVNFIARVKTEFKIGSRYRIPAYHIG